MAKINVIVAANQKAALGKAERQVGRCGGQVIRRYEVFMSKDIVVLTGAVQISMAIA